MSHQASEALVGGFEKVYELLTSPVEIGVFVAVLGIAVALSASNFLALRVIWRLMPDGSTVPKSNSKALDEKNSAH